MILNTPGIEPGYWALAGNPILWNSHVAVSKLLDRTVEFGDWGFGIIHEIGPCLLAGKHFGYGTLELERRDFRQFPHVPMPSKRATVRCRSATSATGVPM